MSQEQLAFEYPGAAAGGKAAIAALPAPAQPPAGAGQPAARHRDEMLSFLDEVTRRVRDAGDLGGAGAPAGAGERIRRRNTVRNAQMIAARARRAIEALPAPDLELLRAHGRLLTATREEHETLKAAELADRSTIPLGGSGGSASPRVNRPAAWYSAPR